MIHIRRILSGLFILVLCVTQLPLIAAAQEPLTEQFTSEDGVVSFRYPEEWFVFEPPDDDSVILVANSAISLVGFLERGYPETGEIVMFIYRPSAVGDMLARLDLPVSSTPEDYLRGLIEEDGGFDLDELDFVSTEQIASAVGFDEDGGRFWLFFDMGQDGYFLIDSRGGAAELFLNIETILDIANTVTFTEDSSAAHTPDTDQPDVELSQTYTTPDGSFSFQYPAGWTSGDIDDEDFVGLIPLRADSDTLLFVITPAMFDQMADAGLPEVKASLRLANGLMAMALFDKIAQAELGDSIEFTLNDRPAARVDGIGLRFDVTMITVELDDNTYAAVFVVFKKGQLDAEVATAQAVAASMTLTTAPAAGSDASTLFGSDQTETPPLATCDVFVTTGPVNKRSGPGTGFDSVGALEVGVTLVATGQTTASDGFVWFRLEDDSWVRADVIVTSGDCTALPEVQP